MADPFPVILFYKYVVVADPHAFAAAQRTLCLELALKGRLLIASEGINGTLAGPPSAIDRYIATLKDDPRFSDIEFKASRGDINTFPKLVVKVRKEIVTLNAGDLEPDRDNQLSPADWKQNAIPTPSFSIFGTGSNPQPESLKMRWSAILAISASCLPTLKNSNR